MSSQSLHLLYYIINSRVHILEMLEDRGYDTSDYQNYTESELKILLSEHTRTKSEHAPTVGPLDILVTKAGSTPTSTDKVFIKYKLDDRFKKTDGLIKQISEIYGNSGKTSDPMSDISGDVGINSGGILEKHHCLIILNIDGVLIKPGSRDRPDEDFSRNMYVTNGYFVQIYGLENFMFNVSRNIYVPRHTILTKAETDEMLKLYNIESTKQLPTIQVNDAMAKYIGLRPRQVCKIEVTNITSGISTKYRVCTF